MSQPPSGLYWLQQQKILLKNKRTVHIQGELGQKPELTARNIFPACG